MRTLIAASCLSSFSCLAFAQAGYPAQPVTAVVGFPAGGNADVVLRQLVEGMRAKFPNGIVVMNRPGGGGTVAISSVVQSKPDGYTFAIAPNSNLVIGPQMNQLPYKTPDDYTVIMNLVSFSPLIVVKSDSQFKTAADLVSAARREPGKVSIGYPGEATVSHLNVEDLKKVTGINVTGIPFAGWGQGAPSLLGGHVSAMVAQPGEAMPQLQAGALRALGSLSEKRQAGLPNVPTFREQGFAVGLGAKYLLIMPKETPPAVVAYVHDAAKAAMEDAAFRNFLTVRGIEADYIDPAQAKRQLWDEYRKYTVLLNEMGALKK